MDPRRIKTFCKVVSKACKDGLLTVQQAKTLIGQAKRGELTSAMRGLQTIAER